MSEEATDHLIIVEQAINGSENAAERLICDYQRRIGAFVLGLTGEPSTVDDLLQTIFIKMALSIHRLQHPEQFECWLFRIARNTCMSHLRKRKFFRLFESFQPGIHEREVETVTPTVCAEILQAGLDRLPPRQRELLCLMQEADYSYEDLAQITGSSVSSVRNHLHRAKEAIRRFAHE